MKKNNLVVYKWKTYNLENPEFVKWIQDWLIDKESLFCPWCNQQVIVYFWSYKNNFKKIYFRHKDKDNEAVVKCPYFGKNKDYWIYEWLSKSKNTKDYYETNKSYILENYEFIYKSILAYIFYWTGNYLVNPVKYIWNAIQDMKLVWKLNNKLDLRDLPRLITSHFKKFTVKNNNEYLVYFSTNTNNKYKKFLKIVLKSDISEYKNVHYIAPNKMVFKAPNTYGFDEIKKILE